MPTKTAEYSAQSLTVLEGLDAVRKRPGMYIGSTDSRGLMHCVWEIIDNAVDESLAGFCTNVTVTLLPDGSVEVVAEGPEQALAGLEEALRTGPAFAAVDSCERQPAAVRGVPGFDIR